MLVGNVFNSRIPFISVLDFDSGFARVVVENLSIHERIPGFEPVICNSQGDPELARPFTSMTDY